MLNKSRQGIGLDTIMKCNFANEQKVKSQHTRSAVILVSGNVNVSDVCCDKFITEDTCGHKLVKTCQPFA